MLAFLARPFGLAALALGLASLPATAQVEDIADYGSARGWDVLSLSVEGSFMRCGGVSNDFPFTLELSVEGWVLTIDGPLDNPVEVPAIVDVDRASFEGTFYPLDNGRYGMFLDAGLVDSIRAGSRLAVEVNGQSTPASLTGSTAAMAKIEECVANGGVPPRAAAAKPKPVAPVESDAARMGRGCPAFGELASFPSEAPATATFINGADQAVSIYWIDFDGQIQEYAGLLPGESWSVDSYVGHLWLAKDFDATCHGGVIEVGPGENVFDIR